MEKRKQRAQNNPTYDRNCEFRWRGWYFNHSRWACDLPAPTYYRSWVGPNAVAAVLGHVGHVFTDFSYRRPLGEGNDWALEFSCKVGDLDGVGVDLITLDSDGLISKIEVVMRPHKTVGALRDAMNMRVMRDPRFLEFQKSPNLILEAYKSENIMWPAQKGSAQRNT